MNRHPPIHIERALPATVAIFATACMTVISASAATAVERIAVTEIKQLLMRAATQGEAHGVLTGTGAAYLQRKFDTTSPIEVDVKRLRALPQVGCGRLEVTTRQRGLLINGNRADQELAYHLNVCADGRFPEER